MSTIPDDDTATDVPRHGFTVGNLREILAAAPDSAPIEAVELELIGALIGINLDRIATCRDDAFDHDDPSLTLWGEAFIEANASDNHEMRLVASMMINRTLTELADASDAAAGGAR